MCPSSCKKKKDLKAFLFTHLNFHLDYFSGGMGTDSDSDTVSEKKLKWEQLSGKEIWGNPCGILQFQLTSTNVCLGERGEHAFSFGPTTCPLRADAAELTVGRNKARSCWGEQTPEATETAMTPLVPITSESERTRIAAGSPNVCTN